MNLNLDALKPILVILAWAFAALGIVAMVGVDIPIAGGSAGTFFLGSVALALLGGGAKTG